MKKFFENLVIYLFRYFSRYSYVDRGTISYPTSSNLLYKMTADKNKVTEAPYKKKTHKVVIKDYCDGFTVTVDDEEFYFEQEYVVSGLVAAFKAVGCDDVVYEKMY